MASPPSVGGSASLVSILSVLLALRHAAVAAEDLGSVFLVLVTTEEASGGGPFAMEDNYCLDPTLPRMHSLCRVRILSPKTSIFTDSRIQRLDLEFQHPSRPGTFCQVDWSWSGEVRSGCRRSGGGSWGHRLPPTRTESSSEGTVVVKRVVESEVQCTYKTETIKYYRDGLPGYPEQRPTVAFRLKQTSCVAGIVSGRRNNDYRTTEAPCRYNGRRRCRPLRREQYNKLISDIDSSLTFKDFRENS